MADIATWLKVLSRYKALKSPKWITGFFISVSVNVYIPIIMLAEQHMYKYTFNLSYERHKYTIYNFQSTKEPIGKC